MTPRQRRFCHYYLQSLNAADAARKAGFNHKDAHSYGHRLLQKNPIKSYISERIRKSLEAEIDPIKKRVLNFWNDLVFSEYKAGIDPERLTQHQLKASELLAKYAGLLAEGVNININDADSVNLVIRTVEKAKNESDDRS